MNDPGKYDLKLIREQYLGTIDGASCWTAELYNEIDQHMDLNLYQMFIDTYDREHGHSDRKEAIPQGILEYRNLRSLYSSMEEEWFWIAGRAFQIIRWARDHQFCGRCGSPTGYVKGERGKICPDCGLLSYPRISPAIIVAILKEDQILLARAARFPESFYSVLAGFVESGETLEECLEREVMEEVGITVQKIEYFGSQSWPFPHSLMVAFTAEWESGEIVIDNKEIVEAGWFNAENLPKRPRGPSISGKLIQWFLDSRKELDQ